MSQLRNRLLFDTWQIMAVAILFLGAFHPVYACDPSYANGISNDDMYVYAITSISDPNADVTADVILIDPNGNQYELDGTAQAGVETTNLQQGINGIGGTWSNNGVVYDYGVQYIPAQAADPVQNPYVQITGNTMNPTTLSVSGAGGVPTCGTDTVTVFTFRGGLAWPTFVVNFGQNGGTGTLSMPPDQTRTATSSTTNVNQGNDMGVCATNAGDNTNKVRGTIASVSTSGYQIILPSPSTVADSQSITINP